MAATAIKATANGAALRESTIELGVVGMTCAACVRRVDKALRAVDGVRDANVNLVTHRATVTLDGSVPVDALAVAVENAGYEAVRPGGSESSDEARAKAIEDAEEREHRELRRAFALSASLSVPLPAHVPLEPDNVGLVAAVVGSSRAVCYGLRHPPRRREFLPTLSFPTFNPRAKLDDGSFVVPPSGRP